MLGLEGCHRGPQGRGLSVRVGVVIGALRVEASVLGLEGCHRALRVGASVLGLGFSSGPQGRGLSVRVGVFIGPPG